MTSSELSLMGRLRRVLWLSSHGKGVAASVVETFRESKVETERSMVRKILLGNPAEEAAAEVAAQNERTGDLMLFVMEHSKVDAAEISKKADRLTSLFEHWIWMKRQRLIDQKIMETRSLMIAAILGGVTAMISSLGPVLVDFQSSLSLTQPLANSTQTDSPYWGILLVVPAASFLGVFFSRKRAYLNVLVASATYLLVVYLFSPLVLSI